MKNGKEYPVIEATDISDEKESVYYPSISTSAKDGKTGDHVGTVGKTTIVDTVSYTNLKIGQEYTVSGKLDVYKRQDVIPRKDLDNPGLSFFFA